MVTRCCVPGCKISLGSEELLYGLPSDPLLCKAWEEAVGIPQMPKDAKVCNIHFKSNDYTYYIKGYVGIHPELKKMLKTNAVPSLKLPDIKTYSSRHISKPKKDNIVVPTTGTGKVHQRLLEVPTLCLLPESQSKLKNGDLNLVKETNAGTKNIEKQDAAKLDFDESIPRNIITTPKQVPKQLFLEVVPVELKKPIIEEEESMLVDDEDYYDEDEPSAQTNTWLNTQNNTHLNTQSNTLNTQLNTRLITQSNIVLNSQPNKQPNTQPIAQPNNQLNMQHNIGLNTQNITRVNTQPNNQRITRSSTQLNMQSSSQTQSITLPNNQLNMQHNTQVSTQSNTVAKTECNTILKKLLQSSTQPSTEASTKLLTQHKPQPEKQPFEQPSGIHTMYIKPVNTDSFKKKVKKYQLKVKSMRERCRRMERKREKLIDSLDLVKEFTKCSEIDNILNGNYKKLCSAFGSESGKKSEVSEELIKFAITMNYYSPKAYNYLAQFIELPLLDDIAERVSSGTYILQLDDE